MDCEVEDGYGCDGDGPYGYYVGVIMIWFWFGGHEVEV